MSDPISGNGNDFAIDDLDLRIITQLHDDGRKSAAEIARILNVPRTTVARRIEHLVSERVITVGVYAHGARIGLPVHAMIMLTVEPNKYEEVVAAVSAFDEVRWVGIASGPCDLLIEGLFSSEEHLRVFLLKRLARINGNSRIQTMRIIEVSKITFDWEAMRNAGAKAVRRQASDDRPARDTEYAAGGGPGG